MDSYEIKQRQQRIKDDILDAIWQNPTAVLPLSFTRTNGGKTWAAQQYPDGSDGGRRSDRTTLKQPFTGSNQICVYCNGDFGALQNGCDVFAYLQWLWNTNDFVEVITRAGEAYNIDTNVFNDDSPQTQRRRQRASEKAVIAELAKCVTSALQKNCGDVARAYLQQRNLQPSARMGAWNSTIKKAVAAHLQKTFTSTDARTLNDIVRRNLPTIRKDYADDKAGAWKDFADDYQLAIPYTNGSGNVTGFVLRRTTERSTFTDERGNVVEMPKYLYSYGENHGGTFAKGGYCEALKGGEEPVILVEGILDAEAMKQYGFTNVLALGGQTPTDGDDDAAKSAIKTLLRSNAKKVIYVPDYEYKDVKDAKGNVIGTEEYPTTDATRRTIAALLPYTTGTLDGSGFVSIRIAELETADARKNKTKVDADTFLQQCGANEMGYILENAAQWYEYELKDAARKNRDADTLAAAAIAIYCKIENYAQRNRLKDDIANARTGYLADIKAAGLNAAALAQIDTNGEHSTWAAQMGEVVADMGKAHTTERMAALLTKAQRIQNANTFNTFAAQVNVTREEMHKQVADKPEYLQTTWKLYSRNRRTNTTYVSRKISFAPSAVSIVAAPTNHGKTLVLLQTALNVARSTNKKYLYLSIENDAEQLYVRALTAYMGNVWRADEPNPRGEVRTFIRSADMPKALFTYGGDSININDYINKYWQEIAPYLALVRTDADIDGVASNIEAQVEAWRQNGLEVGGVFIDYLQLLHYPALHAHSRTDEVKGVCDRLNDMAKRTKLPVIMAAQFNRDATRNNGDKLDGIELANIGESAGIENIAEDVYLVWQIDKINPDSKDYTHKGNDIELAPHQYRSRRCFMDVGTDGKTTASNLRRGYLYVENLKARDYATGGYCLLPFNGAAGAITSEESEQ